jgi:amino acid transporter
MDTKLPATTQYDTEKSYNNPLAHAPTHGEEGEAHIVTHYDDGDRPNFLTRLGVTPESFKRRTLSDKHNQLNKTLKSRHLNMIAIGGSIGAGLFVGSGSALRRGGPASLLLCFGIIGIVCVDRGCDCGET